MPEDTATLTASIPTPFLLIDENIVMENIRRIQAYANRCGFRVRPHIKTHKSLRIARMQLDAGAKALSAKQLLRHENLEMGYIPEYPEARIFRLHEEHGWVDVSRCKKPPGIGQRLSIVPVAISHCVNQYDAFYLLTRNGELQKERVDARGRYV